MTTKKIEIGSVVRLRGDGPRMTVLGFHVKANGEATPESNGGCPICGPYPRLDSADGQTIATLMLAQQQWRGRHDAHVQLDSYTMVTCVWIYDGQVVEQSFPIEALVVDEEEDDALYYRLDRLRRRRVRRYRIREED